jgi:hypothetical protein
VRYVDNTVEPPRGGLRGGDRVQQVGIFHLPLLFLFLMYFYHQGC